MSPILLLGLALLAGPLTPPSGPAPTSSARPAAPQGRWKLTARGRDCVQVVAREGDDWRKGRWRCAPAAP